jgi:hypothetical protein
MIQNLFRPSSTWIRCIELLLLLVLFALLARWITILFAGTPLPVPPALSNNPAPRSNLATEMLTSARLFGSHPAGTLSENVRVIGLIADHRMPSSNPNANPNANANPNSAQTGSVIISVDGRPAQAYQIGADVEGRRLVAIRPGEIEMEANGTRQTFQVPASPVLAAPGIVVQTRP